MMDLQLGQITNIMNCLFILIWLLGCIEAEGNFSLVFNDKGHLRNSTSIWSKR